VCIAQKSKKPQVLCCLSPQCCVDDLLGGGLAMKRNGIRWLCLMAMIGSMILLSAQTQPPNTSKSDAVFKQLTSLVGDWEAVQDGVPVTETYTLTANGSALMAETKPANGPAMITMITVDADHLIFTHYCAARNQPQMETGIPDDLQKGVTFSLVRITGMKTPDDWHNTGVKMTLDDKDHMTQRWTYLYKGKPGTTIFHYTRKK
jgi:hypothetical protein